MATILPFVIRPNGSPPARRPAGDATIVIFPGVRYEPRADEPDERRKAAGAASRKRKKN